MEFLLQYELIAPAELKSCKCGHAVKIRIRSRKSLMLYYRCGACRNERSVYSSTFFSYSDSAGRSSSYLTAKTILKFIFYYLQNKTCRQLMTLTGIKSQGTIVVWASFIRERITKYLNTRPKPVGLFNAWPQKI